MGDESDEQDFETSLQDNCRRHTGNDDTYNRIQNYTAVAYKHVMSVLESDTVQLTASNRVKFFSTYCSLGRDELNYLHVILSETHKCLDLDLEDIDVDHWDEVFGKALNFACKDHGEIFFDSNGALHKCLENPMQLFGSCPIDGLTLGRMKQQCNGLVELQNCYKSKLSQCNEPRLIELLDMFFDPIKEDGACNKYIWSTSRIVGTSLGIFVIIIMIVLIAYLPRRMNNDKFNRLQEAK